MLYEIGSALALFQVKKHAAEYLKFVNGPTAEPTPDALATTQEEAPLAEVEDAPNATRIEDYTRDFVIETMLKRITGHEFEHSSRTYCEQWAIAQKSPRLREMAASMSSPIETHSGSSHRSSRCSASGP